MLDVFRDRAGLSLAILLLILIICNLAFAYSNGWSRWGWQLFSFAGLFAIYKLSGLSLNDIGLSRISMSKGLIYAGLTIAIVFAALTIAYLIDQSLFKDNRYHHSLSSAITAGLLIVPLKTVLFEEFAFRGVMPALLKDLGSKPWIILVITSLLFGIWHILTAPKGGNLAVGADSNLLIVGVVFLATFMGGAVLYYLRYKSNSLVAPIVVHWFINGSAIVLAALSWSAK
jgi:uncharacterized protein